MSRQKEFHDSDYYKKLSKHLIGSDVVYFDNVTELHFREYIHDYSGFSVNLCCSGWAQLTLPGRVMKMRPCDLFFCNSLDKLQDVQYSEDFMMQSVWVSPAIMQMLHRECPLPMSDGFSASLVSACCCDDSMLSSVSASVLRADSRDRAKLSSASTSLFYAGCCEKTKLSTAFELLTAVILDEEHPFAREMVASMIELIFAQLAKDETQPLSSRASLIVEAFKKELEKHYSDSRSAAFYAQSQCISVNYLNKCCNYVDGISTQECINRRLLFHAKRLLKDRKLIIKEVAVALGFPNLTSFSKFFRKQTGQSPTLYQRNSGCSNDVEE